MLTQYVKLLTLVALCFLPNDAIICYQCNSLAEPGCSAESFDYGLEILTTSCDDVPTPNANEEYLNVTKCMKALTKQKDKNHQTVVIRDCHFETANGTACHYDSKFQLDSCHICEGDLCNGASYGQITHTYILVVFLIIAINVNKLCLN